MHYQNEGDMNRIKQTVKDGIVDDACEVFLSRSISDTTIKDIAVKAGVGEATVYRYFKNKQNLVALCAVKLQERVYNEYFKLVGDSGYERLRKFYGSYIEIFKSHPEFYRFINEFDAFTLTFSPDLDAYSDGLDLFKEQFFSAYRLGVKDKSVREVKDAETFYYATTHAMLELCKKLSVDIRIVKQDDKIKKDEEACALAEIILSALKV